MGFDIQDGIDCTRGENYWLGTLERCILERLMSRELFVKPKGQIRMSCREEGWQDSVDTW